MHAVIGHQARPGYDAYRAMSWRLVCCWPFLPLLYLAPIRAVGQRIYRRVADSRMCSISQPPPAVPIRSRATARNRVAVVAVGTTLIAGNTWTGAAEIIKSWPFACYTTFDHPVGHYEMTIRIDAVGTDGQVRPLVPDDYRSIFSQRWNHLLNRVLHNPDEQRRQVQFRAMWQVLRKHDSTIPRAEAVRFYGVYSPLDPQRWDETPTEQELIYEIFPAEPADG